MLLSLVSVLCSVCIGSSTDVDMYCLQLKSNFYLITIIIQTMKRNLIILAAFILASTMFAQAQSRYRNYNAQCQCRIGCSVNNKRNFTSANDKCTKNCYCRTGRWFDSLSNRCRFRFMDAYSRCMDKAHQHFRPHQHFIGTSTGFAANTSGSVIAVVLGGTPVPLPDAQSLGANVTVNGANNTFTVATKPEGTDWPMVLTLLADCW